MIMGDALVVSDAHSNSDSVRNSTKRRLPIKCKTEEPNVVPIFNITPSVTPTSYLELDALYSEIVETSAFVSPSAPRQPPLSAHFRTNSLTRACDSLPTAQQIGLSRCAPPSSSFLTEINAPNEVERIDNEEYQEMTVGRVESSVCDHTDCEKSETNEKNTPVATTTIPPMNSFRYVFANTVEQARSIERWH